MFILPLTLAFGPAAVWVLRRYSVRGVWLLCALTLLLIGLVSLSLSIVFSVPSPRDVVTYMLILWGLPIFLSSGALALASSVTGRLSSQLTATLAGSLVGLGVGFCVTTYWLYRL